MPKSLSARMRFTLRFLTGWLETESAAQYANIAYDQTPERSEYDWPR